MEDEKLADKLLDRILMVLMPYDQIDVERIKAKLTVVLDDYQICPKQEALVVYTEGKNDYYLRKFLLAKAVAGRQERTLRQYKDEVGRVLRGIGKDADTITADDIQVYLAKVLSRGGSKCYCDNIRRDLSSFYNWLYREEIIRTNPMNKIDNIKFKREKEKALTDMEIEMMRQACQTTMQKAIMEMLLSTGCRAAELVSIKIADMDDMGAIIEGKAAAWELVEEVDNYLQTNLGLNLNQKTAVIPIGNPVEFVGRKISPVKIELRRQTTLGMKKHLRYVQDAYAAGEIDLDYALSVITSYRGLFKDVTSDAFLEKMLDEFVLSRPALEA